MKNNRKNDLLKRVVWSVTSVMVILGMFLVFTLLLKYVFKISFPAWLNLWTGVWILYLFIFLLFIRKQKETPVIYRAHFWSFVLQLLILTIIIHYIGGIDSFGVLFYTFFIVYGIFLLPKRYSLVMVLVSLLFFSGLVFLEYSEILPHYVLFGSESAHRNLKHIFTRLLMTMAVFVFLFFIAIRFSEKLRLQGENLLKAQSESKTINFELKEKVKELEVAKNALEEIKTALEIKVGARIKELKELTENLEEQVKQRTRELQEKVQELEKFQKLAVSREIKMVELKKEIKEYEKKLEEQK